MIGTLRKICLGFEALKKTKNLQTLSERIKIVRLTDDQGQYRYQKGESLCETLRHFIRTPICDIPAGRLFAKPITHHKILA